MGRGSIRPGEGHARPLPLTVTSGWAQPRQEAAISDAVSASAFSPGVVAWAESVADALRREDRFPSASVLVHDPEADGLRRVAQRLAPDDSGGAEPAWVVPLTGSICGWVFRMGRPALVGDVANHGDYLGHPGSATRSELAAPILVAGRPIGVLNVESPRAGEFGIDDLERLERRAAEAAASIPLEALPAG